MTAERPSDEPPRIRRLRWPAGVPDSILVACGRCGTYLPATDAQLAGLEPLRHDLPWCGWSAQHDWRAELPAEAT